jgi:spermidine synthase
MNGTENITITSDRIFYTDKPNLIIMDSIETPLMKEFANIVTENGGDILEIGFGMGISADFIYNSNIKSYTCIEIHPSIYEKALEWSKDKSNVKIILGNWIDIIPTLNDKFDGIFMDTFEFSNYEKFESYCKNIANDNCVLSIFGNNMHSKSYETKLFNFEIVDYLEMNTNTFNINYSYFKNGSFSKKTKSSKLI